MSVLIAWMTAVLKVVGDTELTLMMTSTQVVNVTIKQQYCSRLYSHPNAQKPDKQHIQVYAFTGRPTRSWLVLIEVTITDYNKD